MKHRIDPRWDSQKREAYTQCLCAWDSRVDAPNSNPTTAGIRHMEDVRKAIRGVITIKFGRKHYTATCSAHGMLYTGTVEQIINFVHDEQPCPFESGGKTQELIELIITAKTRCAVCMPFVEKV